MVPVSVRISVAIVFAVAISVSVGVANLEGLQFFRVLPQAATAKFFLLFVLTLVYPPLQLLYPLIQAAGLWFAAAHFNAALRRIIECIVRNKDH
jgi:hypothetical protein